MQQNSGISLTFEPANRSSEMELILVYNVDSGFFNIVKNGLRARIPMGCWPCNSSIISLIIGI